MFSNIEAGGMRESLELEGAAGANRYRRSYDGRSDKQTEFLARAISAKRKGDFGETNPH
jgi:hypothetical protein